MPARFGAKKSLGQHFLHDASLLSRIVAAAEIDASTTVIEVGPGPGGLTTLLAAAARHLISVEIDDAFYARLREKYAGAASVTVVHADILNCDPEQLLATAGLPAEQDYVLIGNLPYNIGTAIIRRFLESRRPPQRIVVLLQKEVAQSILAQPGEMGLLSVSVQLYAEARKLFDIPPGAFSPPPKVTSTLLRLDRRPVPLVPEAERPHFFRVVRAGFSAPRKQLRNSLAQGLGLEAEGVGRLIAAAGLEPEQRPQTLSVTDWLSLARTVQEPSDAD